MLGLGFFKSATDFSRSLAAHPIGAWGLGFRVGLAFRVLGLGFSI